MMTAAICTTCLPPARDLVTYEYPSSVLMVIGAAIFIAGLLVWKQ